MAKNNMESGDFCYKYPRPAASVDCVVLSWRDSRLNVLLIQRANDPFQGQWALPGGFVDIDENLNVAAQRELQEETGLYDISVQQIGTFGDVGRDPRSRVISTAYLAMVLQSDHHPKAADDADEADWFPFSFLSDLPSLAFDHQEIIRTTMRQIKTDLYCTPFGRDLLPQSFSIEQMQKLYESVFSLAAGTNRTLDSSSFRRELLESKWLEPSESTRSIEMLPTGATGKQSQQLQSEKFRFCDVRENAIGTFGGIKFKFES